MIPEIVRCVRKASQEVVCGLELFGSEPDQGRRLEVVVEQFPGVFPPVVVRRKAQRPIEPHANVALDGQMS